MLKDPYIGFAKRYDWMKGQNPDRDLFFRKLFENHKVSEVLDCACGTGHDLILFHSFGCNVYGSDVSDSMLAQTRKNLTEAKIDIPVKKADYRDLEKYYDSHFDAVVCLSNAINEPLGDTETIRALCSMKAVLRTGGILVFDQGQSDASMENPPRFAPVVNTRDCSRLFAMNYAGDVMKVDIFDFTHTEDHINFNHTHVQIQIRLKADWDRILDKAKVTKVEYFGDWAFTQYDKEKSKRLIAVAQK
jgi:ubiquinone/menaquinone biosynthesis C-methylase UbiE